MTPPLLSLCAMIHPRASYKRKRSRFAPHFQVRCRALFNFYDTAQISTLRHVQNALDGCAQRSSKLIQDWHRSRIVLFKIIKHEWLERPIEQ
jgi:hypothetical protein